MKKFMNKVVECKNRVAAATAGVVTSLIATGAHAGIDLTGVTVDTTDYTLIASFLIAALVTFWGIKKGLALVK